MSNMQHAPSWLLELPNELLFVIATILKGNNQTLSAMIRSCKRLKSIAQSFLYEDIAISRGSETQATYLVRTLLEKPIYASQIDKISLSLNMSESQGSLANRRLGDTIGILHDPNCVANMMKHFESLNSHQQLEGWISGVLSGYRECIAAMLLTMLPNTTELRLFTYATSTMAQPQSHILSVLFGDRLRLTFASEIPKIFGSRLSKITRLSILGGSIGLVGLPFDALEILEVELVAEGRRSSLHNGSTFRNHINYDSMFHAPTSPRLRTLILYTDWAELLPHTTDDDHMICELVQYICGPSIRQLEVYITRSPRHAPTRDASFANLVTYIGLGTGGGSIECLRIDYRRCQDFDPRACLGDFSHAHSFTRFSCLRELIVLQQVLISSNYQRTLDWQSSLGFLFPPTLESLTIVCPTEATLHWIDFIRVERMQGQVINLHEITLLCRIGHGGSPATFYTGVAKDLFRTLLEMGMIVKVEEEVPGAFEKQARQHGSVWEADWAEEGWAHRMLGIE